MIFDTLYKRTSAGKVQTWCMEVDGNRHRVISGQIDGVKTESGWTVCEGKNVGRANETTPEEQAMFEVEAQYKKKLAQGNYNKSIEDIDVDNFTKPMLAKKYEGTLFPNSLAQPKLDGVRCIATADGLSSRQGKPIVSCPHIHEALQNVFQNWSRAEPLKLDGELYNHQLRDDFNQIISLVRKTKLTEEDLAESASVVEYHLYDAIVAGRYVDRLEILEEIVDHFSVPGIKLVTTTVLTEENFDETYARIMEQGYEGMMVRDGDSEYEPKRSKYLLKHKDFLDEEFTIVDIVEGVGNWSGYAKSISLVTKDDKPFSAGIKGSQEQMKALLERRADVIGSEATVRYQNLTPDGIPRFPVVYAIHEGARVL